MTIKQRFQKSLKCGTGEAYLILRKNPTLNVYRALKKAILKNQSYDPQCEGNRAAYLMQFINIYPKKNKLVKVILRGLKKERKDAWALEQLFELCKLLAQQGNNTARQAIYNRYHKKIIAGSSWCGENAILELDGLEGLKYIAHIRGRALSKDPEDWESGFLLDRFQQQNPNLNVVAALKEAAKNRPLISVYLKNIETTKANWAKSTAQRPSFEASYEHIKKAIEHSKLFIATKNLEKLSKATIKELSNDFEQESRPDIQENYLRIFSRIKFSNSYTFLLNFVKNQKDPWLIELGCKALGFFKNKKIRKFAFKQLKEAKHKPAYLPLLVLNYKKRDWRLLAVLAQTHRNKEDIHDLVIYFLKIYKQHKTKNCQLPLEFLYRKLNCGIHRYDLVKMLWKRKVLSARILKELPFDSNENIRKLYIKIKNKRTQKLS